MSMSEIYMTLRGVLISCGNSLVNGKPRGDVTEGDMRTSRLRFKYALRQCQSNDEIMRADAWGGMALKNSNKVQNKKILFYYIFSLKNLYIFI